MSGWHRSRRADLGLRLVGLALSAVACAVVAWLYADLHGGGGQPPSLPDCGLAAIAFLAAVSGGVLTVLGRHLFDEVHASGRRTGTDEATMMPPLPRRPAASVYASAMRKSGIDLA